MDIDFGGKRALVTGAGRGIGLETVIKLLQCNAKVVALDIDQGSLDSLKNMHPDVETVQADVSDWNGTKQLVEDLGPIDLLVNNAGILELQKIGSVTEDCLSRILDVNVKSLFNISQVVSNGIKARGAKGTAIVNLSSISSKVPVEGFGPYCVSKAAVSMLTQVLAVELGPYQIRVNSVCPTIVSATDMGKLATDGVGKNLQAFMDRVPMGRTAEPSQIAEAIVFLLSDRAALIHGVNLPVDAGLLAT